MGGLPGWLPADLAVPESAGAACLPCRLPTLSLALFPAPIPPPPLPLRGRGIFTFHMQGAPPLASPRLRRRRHGLNLRCRCPLGGLPGWSPADLATVVSAGAACLRCRLPTPPFACFFAPIPPPPFPSGEGGALRLFYARGFAPCIPGAGREAALAFLVENGFLWLSQRCKGIQSLAGWDAALVNSAASQGEGGPGEMELSVASDGGV